MENLRSLQLGVLLSIIDNTLEEIAEAEYDYNYSKNKEILEAAYKAIETKRNLLSFIKLLYNKNYYFTSELVGCKLHSTASILRVNKAYKKDFKPNYLITQKEMV